ncbi:MAG: BrnT family toxin [Methylococcaceae bacterium]|nr:BrnT family toxin [Methylococcaceae bacterium]
MNIKFVWDEHKAVRNLQKHQISFEMATRIFADPFALAYQDRIENGEYRWQTIGMVDGCLLLLAAHTTEENNDTEIIRIISARRADPKERKRYEQAIR